jgi:hypothetical protein
MINGPRRKRQGARALPQTSHHSARSLGGQALSSAPLLSRVALARFGLPNTSLHTLVAITQQQSLVVAPRRARHRLPLGYVITMPWGSLKRTPRTTL